MQHATASGATLRPDFVLIDDPQSDDTARSQGQIDKRMKTIKTSVLGLAGQNKAITVVMAATIIQKYDLAYRFLDRSEHPEWQGVTRKMLGAFPDDMEFWESEYHEAYLHSLELQDDNKHVNSFYRKNRKRLEAGAVVNNKHRKGDNDVSALQHAMQLYFQRGRDAFYSEFQNEPIDDSGSLYSITPRLVCSRVNGYDKGIAPEGAKFLTCMADVNYIGLNWVTAGFDNDFTSWIVDYGKFPGGSNMLYNPEKDTERTASQAISKGIMQLVQFFMEKEFGNHRQLNLLMIDGNFQTETVCKTVEAVRHKYKPPFKIVVHRGRGHKSYKLKQATLVGKPGDECHLENTPMRGMQIIQNSDYWRMATQKAFLNEPGVAGSCSLFGKRPIEHDGIAREICSERLDNFASTDKGNMYVWNMTPGQANDKLDALVACFAGASLLGASFTGGNSKPKPSKRNKKPKLPPKNGSTIRRRY